MPGRKAVGGVAPAVDFGAGFFAVIQSVVWFYAILGGRVGRRGLKLIKVTRLRAVSSARMLRLAAVALSSSSRFPARCPRLAIARIRCRHVLVLYLSLPRTTREIPAAMVASAHGPVRGPVLLQG